MRPPRPPQVISSSNPNRRNSPSMAWDHFGKFIDEEGQFLAVLAVERAALRAAFVEGFADFHATVKGVVSKLPRGNIFIFTLGRLKSSKSRLDLFAPMIKDVKQLDCPVKKTWDLIKKMKMGEKHLFLFMGRNKCCNINYCASKIYDLVSEIIEFCLSDLRILLTIGGPMWKMVLTHCPQFDIEAFWAAFVEDFADFHATVEGFADFHATVKGFADFHATVKGLADFDGTGVVSKLPCRKIFIVTLGRLKSTLDLLAPMIKDVKQLDFDCPLKETWDLIKEMKMVKEQLFQFMHWNKCRIIDYRFIYRNECLNIDYGSKIDYLMSEIDYRFMHRNKCHNIYYSSKINYLVSEMDYLVSEMDYFVSKIDDLVSKIGEFCLSDLQIVPTIGEPMWKIVQTRCPQFEIEGAALRAAFVEGFMDFHATVKGMVDKLPHGNTFIVTLGHLESTLDRLAPMVKDVKQLDCGEKKTWDLIKKIKIGKQLVQFMSWNKCRNINYQSIIDDLVSNIVKFFLFDLQILQTIEEPIWKMVRMHCPQFEIEAHRESIFPVIANQVPRHLEAAALSPSTPIPHPLEKVVSLPMNSQWQKGDLIGRGSFGSVYIATNRNTSALRAIKEVKICPDVKKSADSIKQLWQEIKILSKLKHPNIVQYYGSEIVDSLFRIYLEYVPEGSITVNRAIPKSDVPGGSIRVNKPIPESKVIWHTTDILSGLAYLHSKKIAHRDIKGGNLLIDSSGVVKLADFGLAKHLAPHADAAKLYLIGTAHWMAPELVLPLKPSSPDAADIWSVGCTVLEMLTGEFPWGDIKPKEVVANMGKGKSKVDGNDVRISWKNPKEVKAFCDGSAAQVLDGKKHHGFLRPEGVDVVIKELAAMGKVVTREQFKNKWDHLRKLWKDWKECFGATGLGYDSVTGIIQGTDEWWTRKIQACPKAEFFKNKPLPNIDSMEIMFEGTVATGKHAFCPSGEIPIELSEGSGDSTDSKEFVDPQCEPSSKSVDPMEVECPASSRARPVVNKGKGLASGVQLFRGISKKPRKKRSTIQEMSDSLKSMSDVIAESRSVSTRNTPFRTAAANEMQAIMDMVLSLPGVQAGDRLHMFSTFFFVNNVECRNMFAANVERKDVQLRWLEKQYEMNPQFHVL